jgi:hypothetical protein
VFGIAVAGGLILLALVILFFAAYFIKAESFEFSAVTLRLLTLSVKINSPASRRGTHPVRACPSDQAPSLTWSLKTQPISKSAVITFRYAKRNLRKTTLAFANQHSGLGRSRYAPSADSVRAPRAPSGSVHVYLITRA